MKDALLLAALAVALPGFAGSARAEATPAGLWKTIDDDGKKEKSHVRIVDANGVLSGRIEKLLDAADKPDSVCEKCTDERKDQPVVGLTIIRNVRANADSPGQWDGGDILDPKNGKVYRVRLKTVDDGRKLEVRGYVGAPLFGRTQTWIRVE
ncbi:MAG: DUF2147 domain-containing protein [Rhodocyclaceae bacterium]|nr:DUF2147 domain-containing protein [Rhodocyclaceae bacterium]